MLLPSRVMILFGIVGGFAGDVLAWAVHLVPFVFPWSVYEAMAGVTLAQLLLLATINIMHRRRGE